MILNVLLYSGIAGLVTLVGILMVRWKQDWAIKYSHYVNSFAAGALITIALAELLPESVELASASNAMLCVLLTFIAFYLLESGIIFHSGAAIHLCEGPDCPARMHSKGLVIFSGLFLHSLIDGFVIAVGFEVSPELGLLAALGVILHELPEGITSFVLLLRSMRQRTALLLSVAVALATPVGAGIALGTLGGLSESAMGIMLAVAGGSFLYIAASDLLPETHEKNVLQNATFVLVGAGFVYLLIRIFG